MYMFDRDINYASFDEFSIDFWKCLDRIVFFLIVFLIYNVPNDDL